MDAGISSLLNAVLNGGDSAVVALLVFVCYGLWADRSRLVRQHDDSRDQIDAIAQSQTKSTNAIISAITDLRLARLNDALR